MSKIVVVGSSNTDMVVRAPYMPTPGETILGGTFFMNQGGKGANQAVAVARLGGELTFVTKVGDDIFGKQTIEVFQNEGMDTRYVFVDPNQPSGVALITIDGKGENCIVVAPGANATLGAQEVHRTKELIENASYLLTQFETPMETIEEMARIAHAKGVQVVINPAPAQPISDELFALTSIITPNETEAGILTGIEVKDIESAKRAAEAIRAKGVKTVIVTLGAKGSLVHTEGKFTVIEAQKVEAVDTTAAGDTYNGALVTALSEGKDILEAVRFATRAAAISVTRMGAIPSIPYREEL